ncbi:N-acyl-D-amino-acid deacylase family protein [Bowmanella yangjiangensis]|uniref:Amidohydrolase family protein n=1 Tax=Bowmanella yangjiangensis TaxID=2811230 RepID=A0ABS3CWA8_9ALTE|nr:amidohydrolase family protein [Bowmanella yangjiangensis]MBN7820691.1 amidohydrolase family protein [Bowmanella yangjiangensis]
MSNDFSRLSPLMGALLAAGLLAGCSGSPEQSADYLISSQHIYTGNGTQPMAGVILVKDGKIVDVLPEAPKNLRVAKHIDANNLVVAPGFIDPHTHACNDFDKGQPNLNANYLTQGVTTVFCGNDGGGDVEVGATFDLYEKQGIGSNVALYVGHGAVRTEVMGRENRKASAAELEQMKALVEKAMHEGALGLSTGLYYVPGNYADTAEVVALAKVAAQFGGVYDSHIRDESSYHIGLIAAVQEVLDIARDAEIPVHLAHLKALGVDVWGESQTIIKMVDDAHAKGLHVTADQYPWKASGTSVAGALMPRWALAGTEEEYHARLKDPAQLPGIKVEMQDNLRRRGGADSLLISDPTSGELRGKTLAQVATERGVDPIEAALQIILAGNARVASFNMSEQDIEALVQQDWVVTSSDGSPGHPRKYASFPKKYQDFVQNKPLLTLGEFVLRSSSKTADIFGLDNRGKLQAGYAADLVLFDAAKYAPRADYMHPEVLSEGVQWLFVNGVAAIEEGKLTGELAGQALRKKP